MKEIELTKGYVTLIDDEDFARVSQFSWNSQVIRRKDGSIESVYAAGRNKGREARLLHRFIMGITDPKVEIDHKDQDSLNNQKYNLRVANGNNQKNSRMRIDNTSGFKGVSWSKVSKKWHAYISNKKRIHLGLFTDPLEAACAYDMAAVKCFGEFASCNFAIPY
jgi:AP2 domain